MLLPFVADAVAAKYSVVSTLHHRAKAVCSTQQLLDEEEKHVQKVLTENKYPTWVLNRVKNKIKTPTKQELKRREHANNTKGQKQTLHDTTICKRFE